MAKFLVLRHLSDFLKARSCLRHWSFSKKPNLTLRINSQVLCPTVASVHFHVDLCLKNGLRGFVNGSMQSSLNNIRQVIAKAIGIGYQVVMDDKEEEEVYFGDADMQSRFVARELNLLKKDKNIIASSFKHMNSTSYTYPQQTDGHNCGVTALWYNLIYLKDKGYIVDESMTTLAKSKINVRSIRHQMLLYLFCMKFYFSNLEKIDKDKSMFWNVIDLGKSEFGEELNYILEDIFITNVEQKGNDDQKNYDNECEEDKES